MFVIVYGKSGSDIDWEGLVCLFYMLVFYMGVSWVVLIFNNLISVGFDGFFFVVIVENGFLFE